MIEISQLLNAVLKRNVPQVKECVKEGLLGYGKDENGRSYLHLSVFLRSEELVEYFLNIGSDVNERDREKVTALHRACRAGYDNIVELLLKYGANVEARAKNDICPLHVAAAFANTRCAQLLCSKSKYINVDCRDRQDHTPLHYAANDGHIDTAVALIEQGASVDAVNINGNTPLHFAATSRTSELCQVFLHSSADINAVNCKGQTALHLATQQACASTVIFLLSAEADPNIKDLEGNTCSHLAIKNGYIELVKILMMDPRTDPSISDKEQNTVLHVALKLGHFNLIPMMLPRARELTKQDANGCSVIIEAIKNQLEDLALEMLRTCPSLVHTATHDLVTPLHLAAERGMTNLTKQLLIAGAQVDAADSSGLTPSLYCAKNDSVLECLAMIEDIMMIADNSIDESDQHVKGNNSKMSSRISS